MTSCSGDGGSRVSIPADLVPTIQNIREATGKQHSDDDIFSVFTECFNDPHETIQKLLFLDTFHEVRSKREKKKENLVPTTQGKRSNGRRNFASSHNDASNGRSAALKKPSGANHIVGGSRTASSAPNLTSPPSRINNHKIQDASISPVNKRVTEEVLPSKSTSSSEDVVEPDESNASTVPVVVIDSVVENGTQYAVDGTSQISQQSEQVLRSEAAANKGKHQSLLKSDVGERPHVTFPVHLQVAKILETGLTFGSFDSNFVKEASSDHCNIERDDSNSESSHASGASARQAISTLSQDKDHETNSASETELTLQPNLTVHPVEGSGEDKLKEFLPITDTRQAANGDVLPITYPDQYSIAASQQAMHLIRQQYPLNLFPYGPYYPPYYMPPPYLHQFLSPNGFQHPSYMPPVDGALAPPGPKLPPTHIKPGGDIGNSPPTTIPSPYDSYAFNYIPSATTVNSSHEEEKKGNIYTTGPLNLANLQVGPMYNLSLQGHPLAFPTMQAGYPGIYQQTQPIMTAPTVSAMNEPIGLSHVTNQQPQAAVTNVGNNY